MMHASWQERLGHPGLGAGAEQLFLAVVVPVLFALYAGVRAFAWANAPLLEDHDSVYYLRGIIAVGTFDWAAYRGLGPDLTPFYPFLGGLLHAAGLSPEAAARSVSFGFSLAMFVAVYAIARRLGGILAVVIGLVLVTFNPTLIRLSYAVLTEPSFIATVYLIFWFFLWQREQAAPWQGLILGLLLGLAFLNRIEGVIFVGAILGLQALLAFRQRPRPAPARLAGWAALLCLAFGLTAAPQIVYVSSQMGQLAVNGRQVWSALLHQSGNRSFEEQIYGLDFSPDTINIWYAQAHPDVLPGGSGNLLTEMVETAARNVDELNRQALSALLGVLSLAGFGLGAYVLFVSGRRQYLAMVAVFIGAGLLAPVLHNVVLRHIAVIAPVMLLLAGIGIAWLAEVSAASRLRRPGAAAAIGLGMAAAVSMASTHSLARIYFRPDDVNQDYRPDDLSEPARLVRELVERAGDSPLRLVSRKSYLPYFAGLADAYLPTPYADLDQLREYMRRNDAALLFLEHDDMAQERPFFAAFVRGEAPPDFRLLYRATNFEGNLQELHLFEPVASDDLKRDLD